MIDEVPVVVASGEVPRGEKMLSSGTDPESYITEYTLVYEDFIPKHLHFIALLQENSLHRTVFINCLVVNV